MKKCIFVLLIVLPLMFDSVFAYNVPPDLRSTTLKVGDYWTYKIEFAFAGYNITEIAMALTNNTLSEESIMTLKMFESMFGNITKILNKIEPKITVVSRMNDNITLNFFYYYNETIKCNQNMTFTLYPEWENNNLPTCFPILRPQNDRHDSIMMYVNPILQNASSTIKQSYNIDILQYFSVGTRETNDFYAGAYRTVNEFYLNVPHLIKTAKEILTLFNASEIAEELQSRLKNIELDLEMYARWDKETGIFSGYKFSVRLSSLSWFAYRAFSVYVSSTNLWQTNILHYLSNTFVSSFTGYFENMITYFVNGFILGDETARWSLIIYIIGTIAVLSMLVYILKRMKKHFKSEKQL